MKLDSPLIDVELIKEMLYQEEAYVKEFAEASIQSFSEFQTNFKEFVIARDMENLRRAGHKIKPAALMLHLNPIIEMYEKSKKLLEDNASTNELEILIRSMDQYCNKVLSELKEI